MGKVGSKPVQSPGDDYSKDVKPELDMSLNARVVRLTQSMTDLSQAEAFYKDNLTTFNATSGDQTLQGNLLKLSDKIRERFQTRDANALAFQIQCTAMAMSSFDLEKLPPEIQQQIFFEVQKSEEPILPLLVSKGSVDNVIEMKKNWINSHHISLKRMGCKTVKEAVEFIIKYKLTSANLSEYKEYDSESLQKLIVALEKLSRECPYLTKLTIYSEALPISTFIMMFQKLQNLEYLDLSRCRNLKDPEFLEALRNLSSLQYLDLSGCQVPEYELVKVLKDLAYLKTLKLIGYKPTSDKVRIPEEWLKFCSKLEHLDLSRSKVAEVMILKIVENAECLKHLNLNGCEQISGENLAKALGARVSLEYLNLSYCSNIGDIYAEEIGKLVNLHSLALINCTKITSAKLVEMLTKLVQLQYLNLERCRISGNGFAVSLENLPLMQSLYLSGCYVTNEGNPSFADVLGKSIHLRNLDLKTCRIPPEHLKTALKKLPNLEKVHLSDQTQIAEVQKELPKLKIVTW